MPPESESDQFTFLPLDERSDLLLKSVKFLNEEWPRSDGSREHSQRKSCRPKPPMSFLLIGPENDEIAGHARICLLPNRKSAIWIESVMIKKSLRGRKLGKLLMNKVEDWLIENGFEETFLSTEDQVPFYKSCGYIECPPIVHSTTSTSVFPAMEKFHSSVDPPSLTTPTKSPNHPPPIPNGIPVPPPPPPIKSSQNSIATIHHQYMHKQLI